MKSFVLLWGLVLNGLASQYGPGVMEEVIFNRQNGHAWVGLPDPLPLADGYIAARDCDQLGRIWSLKRHGINESWGRFLVVDCAGPQLRHDGLTGGEWMEANNVMVEISHEQALRWGCVGRGIAIDRLVTEEDLGYE